MSAAPNIVDLGVDMTEFDLANVRAEIFKESGKWMYSINLDYTGFVPTDQGGRYVDPAVVTREALVRATDNGTSGVTFTKIPWGWNLVVVEPPYGFPLMVGATS